MKLFVAGLPNDFDDIDLKEMFELYGEVKSAKLVTDRATGKSKGFGFVEMPDRMEALQTIESLDGAGLRGGKKMAVKEAEEQSRGGNNFNRNDDNRFNRNDDNRFNRNNDSRFNRR
jgi:cold-inducible RNA-binding protein